MERRPRPLLKTMKSFTRLVLLYGSLDLAVSLSHLSISTVIILLSLMVVATHCYQAYTVSDAYSKSHWAAALCNNALVKSDSKYLAEFKKTLPFTPSLITEVVQR